MAWRIAAFLGGVLALWAAAGSPLRAMDHQLLIIHMVQHLLLMTVAAPLILLSLRPAPLLRVHPVFCWLVSTAVVISWHIPVLFMLGMHSQTWHAVEHASFLAAGLLFWWPVVQPWPGWPGWSVPLYLFLATLPCDALSAFLTFCGRVVYPHYLSGPRLQDLYLSPLGDQEAAGALMWVWVTFAYLVPAVGVTIHLLSPEGRTRAEVV